MSKIKLVLAAMVLSIFSMTMGCAIADVTAIDDDTVVVAENDAFLFGLLNEVYVCDVTGGGLANCASNEP